MKEWKLAVSLAKFELLASPIHVLALCLLSPILTIFVAFILLGPQLNDYLLNNYVGYDLLFLFIFIMTPAWLRPRTFLIQTISKNSNLWAAPTLVLQLQWPISIKTLIKSRLIIYFFLSFPLQCILLLSLYAATPQLKTLISPGQYVVFCVIWLTIGVYLGYVMPASDVGDQINTKSVTIAFILLFGGVIAVLTFFHLVIGHGLIHSTVLLAKSYPVLTILSSLILSVIGLLYWGSYMKRQIHKIDYF